MMPYNMPYGSYYRNPYLDNNQQFNNYQVPPVSSQSVVPQPANNDIIWVQGESGAKAYLVAPNTTVTLWDSESPTIYLKSSDGRGVPSMRILDFTERRVAAQNTPNSATTASGGNSSYDKQIAEIEAKYEEIETKVKKLEDRYSELADKPVPKSAAKRERNDD